MPVYYRFRCSILGDLFVSPIVSPELINYQLQTPQGGDKNSEAYVTEIPTTLETGVVLMGLGGGLALFLYGMRKMTEALKIAAGGSMKILLARLTANRFAAALAGTLITAVIQSSSVTTVMLVGFISAGLMTLSQSIGVILGADVGTTITAQVIAFKVTKYALAIIALGFIMELTGKSKKIQQYGVAVMGLGLIFFGMELMSQATYPLRSYQPFIRFMHEMKSPLYGILIGAVFTAVVQSSSATTGVIIVLAGQGFITLEAGIALVFGANIGTCVTALLAGIGKPRDAVRAAVIHVVFKVVGVLLWFRFIPELAGIVEAVSPTSPDLIGTARLAAEAPRQIANAHTIFNVANLFVFIWFTPFLARLSVRIVPDRPVKTEKSIQPKYLDDYFVSNPSLALDRVKMEIVRLGELSLDMVQESLPAVVNGTENDLLSLRKKDEEVDQLHSHIVAYLGKLSMQELVGTQPQQVYEYIACANYTENVGDVVETGLVDDGLERLYQGLEISADIHPMLESLNARALQSVQTAILALATSNRRNAASVIDSKNEFDELADQARVLSAQKLKNNSAHELTLFRLETNIIENLKHIFTLARRISRVVLNMEDSRNPSDGP